MKLFNLNPPAKVRKSAFDLSHERKTTMEMGKLVPILAQEVIPGDKWQVQTESLIRLAPMLAPLYHRINAYVHYFFVPMRLLWDDWEAFITNNMSTSVPTASFPSEVEVGGLGDHLGLPTGAFNVPDRINILPYRAYCQIWNDYYRNEQIQDEIDHKSLTDDLLTMNLLYRNWSKDYFTSALPTPQQGTPSSAEVDIEYKDTSTALDTEGNTIATGSLQIGAVVAGENELYNPGQTKTIRIMNIEEATLEVEELRAANRLQRWLEKNARAGSRYTESLLAHFGVFNSDGRMNRAEYLGGGKTPIVISEVLNMTGDNLPQGYPTGHGISVGQTNTAYLNAKEHGYIFAIMSVTPDPNYSQGIPKIFDRTTPTDFYWPEFAQLGEQEVLNREIYLHPSGTGNSGVFGYQSRYAEYKFIPSTIHGNFRTNLNEWHLSREFSDTPPLNEEFIKCVPRADDIFAVTYDKEHLWVQLYHKIKAVRPMPYFNSPTL